ncbi:MAG: hypothetical protein GC164_09695 [Phycisphaera sp.]|nr:hypothetical protein [Phycisphaera sp.]
MTKTYLKPLLFFVAAAWFMAVSLTGLAQERTLTTEQMQQLEKQGELEDEDATPRPANLPDLTKGQTIENRPKQDYWLLGPTGIESYMVGGLKGDQIEVTQVQPGSPAEGKLQWGDVILAVNGQKFIAGQNMGQLVGNAIIEAEREENKGRLTFRIWRDSNFIKRNGKKDIGGTDVDELFNQANTDESLYDWKPDEEKSKEVRSANFDQFPIDGSVMEVTLELEVLPPYSDTSPYDCPKAQRIRENAWKVLAKQFEPDQRGRMGRGGTWEAVALVASGKPEYIELVRKWVRSDAGKAWHAPTEEDNPLVLPGKSWYMSFTGLDCALYYDATHDDYVLPALTRFAVRTAKGQAGGGSWGHGWAQPIFNGGQLHGMNPGYGALNASGNRCFFLIALAQHLGIKDPEIDAAVERSRRFFGSYVDKGGIPYGHHGAASTDDSNGKNSGAAYAFWLMGDKYSAKYFANMSTHASFTRRGGHGADWFWHWSPYASTLCGPRGVIATQRNMRWWYTLCRSFDGGFVIHSPTGNYKFNRDATATYALHYSVPLKQTLITGKDADESMWWSDEEFAKFMTIARGQFYDPKLMEQVGKPWPERNTQDLYPLLNVFKPNTREAVAKELAKRYANGEKDILTRVVSLLDSDDARMRDGACCALDAMGPETSIQYLSKFAQLLKDPQEFVRMRAANAMAKASDSAETELALLKATVDTDMSKTMGPNSLPSLTQSLLFGGDSKLAKEPFKAGLDDEMVLDALEKLITLDPMGNRPFLRKRDGDWASDTVVRVAGPLVFSAEEEQIADQMFSSRRAVSLALLERLGYVEVVEAGVSYLRKRGDIPRRLRTQVNFKRGYVKPEILLKYPGVARSYLPWMKQWILDEPLALASDDKEEGPLPLYELIGKIEASKTTQTMPSLAQEAEQLFRSLLDKADSDQTRLAMCRSVLADPERKDTFRKSAAMSYLADTLGGDAVVDILPYLGHDSWRLREQAQTLAVGLVEHGGDTRLVEAFDSADEPTARGILSVFGHTKSEAGRKLAERSLDHASPSVRGQAVKTLLAIAGGDALPRVLGFMNSATDPVELEACESALLSLCTDPAVAQEVRRWAIKTLPQTKPPLRGSLYWLLANIGGPESLSVLRQALNSDNADEYRTVVNALSYCPDPEVDRDFIETIRLNKDNDRAGYAAGQGMRRMVIGPEGIGTKSIDKQLDYAEGVLNSYLDESTIAYLGRIHNGRCAHILQQAMRKGAPQSAARAIIVATSDLSNADEKDRKLAESALIDTIEFIEVTYLRGGASDQIKRNPEAWRTYAMWKTISTAAGKNLMKITKPTKAPLPTFDDSDLGL